MSRFSRNLPPPPRFRFSRDPGTASGGHPLVLSSSPTVVPMPAVVMNTLFDEASSLAPVPSHGHSVNEDVVTPTEPLQPAPRMDKVKQHIEEGFQHKRKRAMSVDSDNSILREGLMANARRTGHEKEFFRINLGVDPTSQLADVADHCRQLPICLLLSVKLLNECLSKFDWKELRRCGQRLPSLCDTMVHFYQVNS